jgi:ParB family chromosome partitioning protein
MVKHQSVNLDNLFSSAEQVYQLTQAESEVERLQAEVNELRATRPQEIEPSLAELRDQLMNRGLPSLIPLSRIQPNPDQPRRTFLPDSIQEIANSLEQEGQLQPVILIEEGENFLIFDGERRWRGATHLGWEHLQAVLIPRPQALHRQALITSLHREDLNPLDKAEAILLEVATLTRITPENLPRSLSAVIRRLTKQKKLSFLSELLTVPSAEQQMGLDSLNLNPSEQSILAALLALQLNPASIDANIFPMLTLEPDLKIAMRERGLGGSHALLLQRLGPNNLQSTPEKATLIRQQATAQVLAQKLSVSQTRQLVQDFRRRYSSTIENPTTAVRAVSSVSQAIAELSPEQLTMVETESLERLAQLLTTKLQDVALILQDRQ